MAAGEVAELREEEAAEGQGGAQNRQQGDALGQNQGGSDDGHHGPQVDIGAGADRAEDFDRPVPTGKTEGRGSQTQKEDVEEVPRLTQARQIPLNIDEKEGRQQEEQPIEEAAARYLQSVIVVPRHFADQYRVEPPDDPAQNRQQVAARIELQRVGAVEVDQEDAGGGQQKTGEKVQSELFILQEEVRADGDRERGQGGDNADIGGVGVEQGDVFQEEIEGDAGEADPREVEFMAAVFDLHPPGAQQVESEETDQEPQEKNLDRGEASEQHFRGDKSHPPNQHGQQGGQVAGYDSVLRQIIVLELPGARAIRQREEFSGLEAQESIEKEIKAPPALMTAGGECMGGGRAGYFFSS